jgi:hypothetical protein
VTRGRTAGLMEAIEDGFMEQMVEQMVDFPTQVKGNILDLIVTNIL